MTINLSTSTDSQGDTLAGFEDVFGTFLNDSITGDDATNEIFGVDGKRCAVRARRRRRPHRKPG
jgi:hypothetical protein